MPEDHRYRRTRPVGALTLFLDGRGLVAVSLALVAVVLHGLLAWDADQVDRFNARAQKATATVTQVVGDEAQVRYDVPQGSFSQRIRAGRLVEGDRVQVYYTPDRPAEIRRALRRDMPLAGWFQGIATGIGAVALWLGWTRGIWVVRALQTRAWGAQEQAEVTRIEVGKPGRHGGPPPVRLHWKRRNGAFGKSFWHHQKHLAVWQPGDMTDIYVWRDNAFWQGDLGPRPERRTRIPQVARSGQDANGS